MLYIEYNIKICLFLKNFQVGEFMFETPTQKNFKRQMREIEKEKKKKGEKDIYNHHNKTVKFSSPSSNSRNFYSKPLAIIITLILFIGPYLLWGNTLKEKGIILTFKKPNTSFSAGKAMPKKYAFFLNQLDELTSSLEPTHAKINEFHQTPYEQRDKKLYKEALLEEIAVSQSSLEKLQNMKPIKIFEPLYELRKSYFSNLIKANKHYLNYLNNNNIIDLEIANEYTKLVNQNSKDYKKTFLSILREHKFKHQIFENGGVRYWYEESPFF